MCFYLEGRLISDGTYFRVDDKFWTIEAALEAARSRLRYESARFWIMDHQQRLILSFQEVRDRLEALSFPPSAHERGVEG